MNKEWLKDNWFKLGILLLVSSFLLIFVLQNSNSYPEITDLKKVIDVKADDYVVSYDGDGNPLTWATLDRTTILLEETVDAFKSFLDELRPSLTKEGELLVSMYQYSSDPKIATLISLYEPYLESGEKLVELLSGLITKYEGMFKAVSMRDEVLYRVYSEEISELESGRRDTMADYQQRLTAKREYAKSILTQ